MAQKLFGTDGIRGMANKYPMTVEMALTVGKSVASFFNDTGGADSIVIGKDTRVSGDMISAALAAGVCAMGFKAIMVGCIPTPAVACLTRSLKAGAGIVVSASHNPYSDNGIKIFGPNGYKLSEEVEAKLEMSLLEEDWEHRSCDIKEPGVVLVETEAASSYLSFLLNCLPDSFSLEGMQVVIDCANGATHHVAPTLFEKLGAGTRIMFSRPDGININERCGSQHPQALAGEVVESGSAVGLAFDGDGDRLTAVDETGEVLTGDQIIAICAKWLHENNELANKQVVTTIMSNIGLKNALSEMGVNHVSSGVGDRLVLEKMIATGAVLGGEDSGHILFLNHHTTGDGILAALKLLQVMQETGLPLSKLKDVMTVYPQVLVNVPVSEKPSIEDVPEIKQAISKTEDRLGANGRVLVRYSGTEPICRVMVEGQTASETSIFANAIADIIKECIG